MTRPASRAASKVRRRIEKAILLAGVIAIGVWAWSNIRGTVSQSWDNWVFDRRMHGQQATVSQYLGAKTSQAADSVKAWLGLHAAPRPSPPQLAPVPQAERPPVIQNGGMVGRLEIPRLRMRAMVREGIDPGTLDLALGHIPGTAWPGQSGNVGVAGHRDTLFRGLRQIERNDLIQFQTLAASYTYRVESTEITKPRDVGVLGAGQYPEITLVTCYPFNYVGSAPDRFIVKARLVSQGPPGPDVSERRQETARQTAARFHKPAKHAPGATRVAFQVSEGRSRRLAPGISFGLSRTDPARGRANGWMWLMPDHRTIWLRNQAAHQPLVFYSYKDGKRRELVLTNVTRNGVTGYLLFFGKAGV